LGPEDVHVNENREARGRGHQSANRGGKEIKNSVKRKGEERGKQHEVNGNL